MSETKCGDPCPEATATKCEKPLGHPGMHEGFSRAGTHSAWWHEVKSLSDYTLDELRALPAYEPFGRDVYRVGEDGTVTLSNGRVLSGLTPGNTLSVPCRQDELRVMFVGEKDPMMWQDEHGEYWAPVLTQDGIKRRPFRL